MPITVSELAIAPVKGMRLHRSSEVELGPRGVTGDREFLVVNDDCKLLLSDRNPRLLQIEFSQVIQKITDGRFDYPIISPEAMRNALREMLANKYKLPCNRERLHDEDQLAVRLHQRRVELNRGAKCFFCKS